MFFVADLLGLFFNLFVFLQCIKFTVFFINHSPNAVIVRLHTSFFLKMSLFFADAFGLFFNLFVFLQCIKFTVFLLIIAQAWQFYCELHFILKCL